MSSRSPAGGVTPAHADAIVLAVVPGATHLFEEPGALAQVSRLAIDWLAHHLNA